ncbi:alpha/beta hydrolase, partial [Streptomyces sp. NPDC000404]
IAQDKFRESFCQDLPEDEALVMAVTQKAPLASNPKTIELMASHASLASHPEPVTDLIEEAANAAF